MTPREAIKALSKLAYRACDGDHAKIKAIDEAVAVLDDLVAEVEADHGVVPTREELSEDASIREEHRCQCSICDP